MDKKRILICGATGFIGRNLLEHFEREDKYLVRATFHNKPPLKKPNNTDWVYADLTNKEHVKRVMKNVDIVLQYAATTSGAKDIVARPYIHVTDNAVMNSLILREAYEQGVEHFVMPSCTIMYQSSEELVSEDDFNESDEIFEKYYGAGYTKVYLEKMCKFYSRLGKTKHTVLRQSNVYGPHDKFDLEKGHVFAATIVKVSQADDGVVVWGTGEEERDLLHVSDLVNCVTATLEKQTSPYELVNVGLGDGISIADLVQEVIYASGKDISIRFDETKPTIKTRLALDISRAKDLFNWEPMVSLSEGIKSTLNWFENQR